MSYIGKSPQTGAYSMLDALTASATASYSLTLDSVAFVPESANHLLVSLNGSIQKAGTSYTCSGSTLTFSSTLASSDSIDFVLALGNVLDVGTVTDGTITKAKTNFVSSGSGYTGTGLDIKGNGSANGRLGLLCSAGSHGVALESPNHSSAQSYTIQLPSNSPTVDKFIKVTSLTGSGATAIAHTQFASAGGTYEKLLSGSASSSVNHDFQNFMDTSKYRMYMALFTDVVSAGTNERLDLQFIADTSVQNGSHYWGSVLGQRSSNTQYTNGYESETQGKGGIGLVMNSANAGNYLFNIINSPNQQDFGNNVFGTNWGYNSSYGDYAFANFTIGYNHSANNTGIRIVESGNNATTFDYEIYGILK